MNKLSEREKGRVLEIANSGEFKDHPPSQIVPKLADRGKYVASESTFYRIFKETGQNAHRSQSNPRKNKAPKALTATGPNQVWSWDITYLPGQWSARSDSTLKIIKKHQNKTSDRH